jgi:hypothetical protein
MPTVSTTYNFYGIIIALQSFFNHRRATEVKKAANRQKEKYITVRGFALWCRV